MFRNLHPKFRYFLEGKSVENFEDLRKLGVEYEKRRELDTRYLPPPPKGMSRIPAAAFHQDESIVSAASLGNREDAGARGRGPRSDRKKRRAEGASVTSSGNGNTAVDVRVDAFVPANASAREVPQQLHAGVDLGRPLSSALPAAQFVPPVETRVIVEAQALGGVVSCVKTSGISRANVRFPFVMHVASRATMLMHVRRGEERQEIRSLRAPRIIVREYRAA